MATKRKSPAPAPEVEPETVEAVETETVVQVEQVIGDEAITYPDGVANSYASQIKTIGGVDYDMVTTPDPVLRAAQAAADAEQ